MACSNRAPIGIIKKHLMYSLISAKPATLFPCLDESGGSDVWSQPKKFPGDAPVMHIISNRGGRRRLTFVHYKILNLPWRDGLGMRPTSSELDHVKVMRLSCDSCNCCIQTITWRKCVFSLPPLSYMHGKSRPDLRD